MTLDELLLVLLPDSSLSEAERMLRLLDVHDLSLRAVAIVAADGFTRGEIASRLGQSLSAIEQKVRAIKAILGPVFGRMDVRAM
jgi:DNA-binding NarL/FixJ family response regulator